MILLHIIYTDRDPSQPYLEMPESKADVLSALWFSQCTFPCCNKDDMNHCVLLSAVVMSGICLLLALPWCIVISPFEKTVLLYPLVPRMFSKTSHADPHSGKHCLMMTIPEEHSSEMTLWLSGVSTVNPKWKWMILFSRIEIYLQDWITQILRPNALVGHKFTAEWNDKPGHESTLKRGRK